MTMKFHSFITGVVVLEHRILSNALPVKAKVYCPLLFIILNPAMKVFRFVWKNTGATAPFARFAIGRTSIVSVLNPFTWKLDKVCHQLALLNDMNAFLPGTSVRSFCSV